LTDLLVEGGDQADYILDTKIENLYLLPSGSVPPNPSGLLGSERMAELAQDFAFFADLVLFDAPPVLVGADAMLLASQMDGVLLLVDGSSTRPEAAKRALKMLQNAQARVLGAVLNRAHIVHSDYYYYYSNRKEPKSLLQGQWDRLQTAIMRRIPALNDWLGRDGS
jgi:capsular exopolysaccharide synthesis family protein